MDRFTVTEETVIDNRTGLMWTRSAGFFGFPLTWVEALDSIKMLNRSGFAGHHDWKLPNRRELFSLISHETINPCLPDGHPFTDVFTGYYWTSTSCVRLPDQAWYIHLGGARVFKGMKHGSYMVWPVRVADTHPACLLRSGQQQCYNEKGLLIDCFNTGQDGEFQAGAAWPENRFTNQGNLVTDRVTALTWLGNANDYQTTMDWATALDRVRQMNKETKYGRADWRVPTIAELESLIDMGRHSPALPEEKPFTDVQEFYWSSTSSRYDTEYAWVLYMIDGIVGVGYKPLAEFYLWPVSGQRQAHS